MKYPALSRFKFILLMVILSLAAYGQNVTALIESNNFVFQLQSVSPMKGGLLMQNPGYTVTIGKDSVDCNLPYFGRMYNPSYGSTDSGLKFLSTQFEVKKDARKKGGWNINYKFADTKSVSKMLFTIFENGKASISVICKDRETISYSGFIEQRK